MATNSLQLSLCPQCQRPYIYYEIDPADVPFESQSLLNYVRLCKCGERFDMSKNKIEFTEPTKEELYEMMQSVVSASYTTEQAQDIINNILDDV